MTAVALNRELVTPEGVDLDIRLADAGERISAFLLDVTIMVAALVGLTVAVIVLARVLPLATGEILNIIWLLGFFLLRNFYFTGFELTSRAATPGKRIVGLRVAMREGSPLTATAIFARNAMRELEIFLPLSFMIVRPGQVDAWIGITGMIWCVVFVFFPLFNRDRLRVGDLVGGTWVVVAPKRILDRDLSTDGASGRVIFSEAALDAYGIKELKILESVLRRRDEATMYAVAARIRTKIKFDRPLPDQEFLSTYYTALRGRLESRLLFGKRRRDKHDKA